MARFEMEASALAEELDEAKNDIDESVLCMSGFSESTHETIDAFNIIQNSVSKVGRSLRHANGDMEPDRKRLADINRTVKNAVETIILANARLDILARRYAFELLLRSNSETTERDVRPWKRTTRILYRNARKVFYIACSIVTWCMTIALVWSETTIWTRKAFSVDLCPISNFPALSGPFLAYIIWCVSQSNALTWWRVRRRMHMATDMNSMVLLSAAVLAISFSCIKNFVVLLNEKNTAFLYIFNIAVPAIIFVVASLYSIPFVERTAVAAKNSIRAFKLTRESGAEELVCRLHATNK
jgi:hypothetical protein